MTTRNNLLSRHCCVKIMMFTSVWHFFVTMKCLCFSQNVCIFKFNYTGHSVNEWVMKNTGMYWNIRCCWFQLVPTFLRLFSNHNMTRLKTAWNTVYNCCHKSHVVQYSYIYKVTKSATDNLHIPVPYIRSISTQSLLNVVTMMNTVTHTHTHPFNGPFFRDYLGEPVPKR